MYWSELSPSMPWDKLNAIFPNIPPAKGISLLDVFFTVYVCVLQDSVEIGRYCRLIFVFHSRTFVEAVCFSPKADAVRYWAELMQQFYSTHFNLSRLPGIFLIYFLSLPSIFSNLQLKSGLQ